MKTKQILFSVCLIAISLTATSQIKVFTGGNTIVGSTNSPVTGAKLQVAGTTIFTTATGTVTPSFAAYIRSANGASTATTPDYTWNTDNTTGIFHSAAGLIQFSINGSEKFKMTSAGQFVSTNTLSIATAPEFSWNNDPNTGIINSGVDLIGFCTGGVERVRVNNSFQLLNRNTSSVAATPDFSWSNDANTGLFNPASDALGFSTNGSEKMRIESSGKVMIGVTSSLNDKLTVVGATDQNTIRTTATHTADYGYAHYSSVNMGLTKNWAVNLSGTENFFVFGSGQAYARGWNTLSDGTLKNNVNTLTNSLQKVLQLRGVSYNMIDEAENQSLYGPTKTYYGLIAQEVEAVLPNTAIVSTLKDGKKTVSYSALVGLLVEAIKEQNNELQQLKTDMNACCQGKSVNGFGNRTINTTETINSETTNWLAQNKPNPFSKETVIEYNVIQEGKGSILVFDMNGKLLKTITVKIPGKGSVTITANDLPAGMYYYTLVVNDTEVDTKKMILTQ